MAKRGWRWTSTPLSADRGEVSVLAVAETIAASSISLWIAWHYQTVTHIAVSACLAPILLLRTHRSTVLTLFLANKLQKMENDLEYKMKNVSFIIAVPVLTISTIMTAFIAPFVLRILVVSFLTIIRPICSISHIPVNWRKLILSYDSTILPELYPGIERLKGKKLFVELQLYRFSVPLFVFRTTLGLGNIFQKAIFLLPFPIAIAVVFLPSISYRWSIKSTALIWSPLLWIISSATTIGRVRFRLDNICHGPLYKTMRIYSALVLIAFLSKLAILIGLQKMDLFSPQIRPLLEPFIAPAELPIWQAAAAMSAVLAWVLYFLAEGHLRAIQSGNPNRSSEDAVKWQVGVIATVRNSLAIYTSLCLLYTAWQVAVGLNWPVVEFVLFPWSRSPASP